MIIQIKLAIVLNKNLIAKPCTKIIYSEQATDFNDKEMAKKGSNYICLAVVLINFALKKDKNYYLKLFLKCKYIDLEKKVIRYVTDNQEISSDDSYIED